MSKRIEKALYDACKLALRHTSRTDEVPPQVDRALQRAIKMADTAKPVGELGMPYEKCGSVLQAVAKALTGRGHTLEDIKAGCPDELDDQFWDRFGGPALDWLENELGLTEETK